MNPIDTNELLAARDRLLNHDVVAVPTETVYGLAASIDSDAALRKIFALKERPFFDPLIVHVGSFKQAHEVANEWPPLADYLARQFWPGPLTVVVPKAESINPIITSGLDTVAVRYPMHPVTQELIKMVGRPLAAPSANKFGRTSPSKAEHVRSEFPGTGLLVIDGGECELGVESTVLGFSTSAHGEPEVQILRPGAITHEMLSEALEKWWPKARLTRATSQAAPGQLKHHYMPKIPLVIVSSHEPEGLTDATKSVIASRLPALNGQLIQRPIELVLNSDPTQAARELYSEMRKLAESDSDLIYVRSHESRQDGLWVAIWDRLTRAASLTLS